MTLSDIARGSLLVPLCMVAVAWMGEAMADASVCHSIKDADERAYCLAQARQNHDYCYRIKDGDSRNECLAKTKGSRDRCHAIKGHDRRKACLALIR
ncbi:MAG: hypothetical protein Q7T97_11470 [Burkholderiaceae bacterium]|nr:hypothetical protein [Burkholderiaceae bacterium]